MPWLDRFAMLLLNRLLWTSLQASVLVGIIAMVSRLLQRLPATARCTLWWVVALQVVLGLAWQSPIRLPLLSPPAVTAQVGQHVTQADSAEATGSVGLQPTTRGLQQQLDEARTHAATNAVIQAALVPRRREVPATYPLEARRNGIEGWVDVEFTIASSGDTQDLVVREANPREVFEKAALDAVKRWKFVPVVRDGAAVSQRAILRVRFTMANDGRSP